MTRRLVTEAQLRRRPRIRLRSIQRLAARRATHSPDAAMVSLLRHIRSQAAGLPARLDER
jgi:hypothetical protein